MSGRGRNEAGAQDAAREAAHGSDHEAADWTDGEAAGEAVTTAVQDAGADAARAGSGATSGAAGSGPADRRNSGGPSAASRGRGWLFWLVVAVFAVLYAQDLFQAVTDAFGVPADLEALNNLRAEADQPPIPVPWLPIIVNLLLPPVAFVAAFLIARRRGILVAVLVFALGLALVAAITLDMYLLAGLLVT